MSTRLFFSIPIARGDQLALIRQQAQLGLSAKVVPAAKFHITLAFLGSVTQSQQQQLLARWQQLDIPKCDLILDRWQYWPKAEVFCLNASHIPAPLHHLASDLREDARSHGLYHSKAPFRPHITLYRKLQQAPDININAQPITIQLKTVELIASRFEPGGNQYQCVKRWELGS